jgi:hypothetical protein
MAAEGYDTPELGQAARGGNYTVWLRLRFRDDGKWYSPKDVSGKDREERTPIHVRALKEQILERRDLPRSRRGSVIKV